MYARDRPSVGTTRLSTTSSSSIDETRVDASFGSAVADDRRIGAATDDELERLDEHRLAGAGLPRDGGQPAGEDKVDRLDDTEVLDVQLGQHRPMMHDGATLPARTPSRRARLLQSAGDSRLPGAVR